MRQTKTPTTSQASAWLNIKTPSKENYVDKPKLISFVMKSTI